MASSPIFPRAPRPQPARTRPAPQPLVLCLCVGFLSLSVTGPVPLRAQEPSLDTAQELGVLYTRGEPQPGPEEKSQPEPAPAASRFTRIREAALALLPADRHYRKPLAEAIALAYESKDYLPLWSSPPDLGLLRQPIAQALAGHAFPESMALDPAAIELPASLDFLEAGDFALTVALADAGALLRYGIAPVEALWPEWNKDDTPGEDGRSPEDFAASLRRGANLIAFDLEEALDEMAPQNWIYRQLQEAYGPAREAVLSYSGLPNIPDPESFGRAEPGQPYAYAPALAAHLADKGYLPMSKEQAATLAQQSPRMTPGLVDALKRFQEDLGLEADGILGPATWQVLNTNAADRFHSLTINLHRARLLPQDFGKRYVVVNLPTAELFAFGKDETGDVFEFAMPVVHGMASNPAKRTPVFRDVMQEIVFGPYWNVPTSIAVRDLIPMASEDPAYLARNQYEIVSSFSGAGAQTHPITAGNLDQVAQGRLHLRQRPSSENALGRVKFLFPNPYSVYIHDTPSKNFFGHARRDHSSGCVRVAEPHELGAWVLGSQGWGRQEVHQAMQADRSRSLAVEDRVNVFIVYLTTFPRPKHDGTHVLAPGRDVYERDQPDAETLSQVVSWGKKDGEERMTGE